MTKLIVGLGNPGKQYAKTRHNVGFAIINALREEMKLYGISDWKLSKKFNAEIAEANIREDKVMLAKPMTFMNRSGEAVRLIMDYFKIKPQDLIVIHDDKDLKLGDVKIHTDRGDAGHNGVKSIIEHTGTKDFARARIGVASENKKKMKDTSKFMLGRFGILERKNITAVIKKVVEKIKNELKI